MAKILCIESTTDVCSVCISVDGSVIGLEEELGFRHSAQLLPSIEKSLKTSKVKYTELDAVALSYGPGSYTGLRVGGSTSKGIAYALDLPLIAINTLESLAYVAHNNYSESWDVIIPMLDARRNEVYSASFNKEWICISETTPLIIDDNFKSSIDNSLSYIICGNGSEKVKRLCPGLDNCYFVNTQCSSTGLSELSQDYYDRGEFVNLDHFEPLYLKPPNIATPKKVF